MAVDDPLVEDSPTTDDKGQIPEGSCMSVCPDSTEDNPKGAGAKGKKRAGEQGKAVMRRRSLPWKDSISQCGSRQGPDRK